MRRSRTKAVEFLRQKRAERILFSLCRMEQKSHSNFVFAMALYYDLPVFQEVYQAI